jgi:hypothetical protein
MRHSEPSEESLFGEQTREEGFIARKPCNGEEGPHSADSVRNDEEVCFSHKLLGCAKCFGSYTGVSNDCGQADHHSLCHIL